MHKLLTALLAAGLFLVMALPAFAAPAPPLTVYYAGPEGGVSQALRLAGFSLVSDPALAQTLVLNNSVPDPTALAGRLRDGAGLVLITGPSVSADDMATLLGFPVKIAEKQDPLSLDDTRALPAAAIAAVQWNSAPQVRERYAVQGPGLQPLIQGYGSGEIVLGWAEMGKGTAYVFTPVLSDTANPQIQQWAYFNYLIYHLTTRAGGAGPLSFADYGGSPVPHPGERTRLLLVMAGLILAAFTAFGLVRRYSLAHPETLNGIIANRKLYAGREARTAWDNVGFHRPLGGFLLALMLGLVLFVPLIIYQNLLLPAYILPSAQALGTWDRVVQFFSVLWLFFDMGTSTAFIKFFSQYRVTDPLEGIQYCQLFLWWQALSGAIQVALVITVASTLVPQSAYALYAWSIIVHSLMQVPGFYQVFRHALYGLQRFDYAQAIDMGVSGVFPVLVQPVVVIFMYNWGKTQPAFGAATGGLLGMGIAAYIAEALAFLVGWALYRRLGYGTRVLFLAHFNLRIVKNALRFGVFEMAGSIAWGLGQAVEIGITQVRLLNYAEIWGNWRLAQNFVFAFQVLQTFYGNLMPAMSEATSQGRRLLSQYYEVQGYKWGGMISAFIGAVLLAVADRFILGASGPEFARAAAYAVPLVLWGAIQYPSWVGDNVQRAANRPYLITILIAGEQAVRITLAWLLLARFQVTGLIIAYFAGLLAKDIAGYIINNRLCFPHRFFAWQSLAAPALAGAVHFLVLRTVTGLLWRGDQVTSVLIFFVGILPSFPLFAFLYALFGGWDDDTLEELRCSVPLSGFMKPLASLFWWASAQGARLSPLHNRFPITIGQAALAEAHALTAERVEL